MPGQALLGFLIGYGLLRFSLEFLRDTIRPFGVLTTGQMLAAAQVMFGSVLFAFSKFKKPTSLEHFNVETR
jgi:prolipoprotein diacylglyceryltransferase